jgi:hypothetical protein
MMRVGKCVLTGACLLAGYALLLKSFRLMNLPSDRSLYSGLAIVAALLVLVPAALWTIWRKRT